VYTGVLIFSKIPFIDSKWYSKVLVLQTTSKQEGYAKKTVEKANNKNES
jgi:hypothetical protein